MFVGGVMGFQVGAGKTRKIEKFGKRPDFERDFKDPFVIARCGKIQ
jgi:hypothetical protein